ncbi:MAG: pseudouridine synthase [Fusicatenibacter sp.]|nr:pseudouridine synthase [Lachnospiraceae bacterium]MDY2937922.1 pseudouridine synthase [Fusicatenibacter sp.]
MRLNKYLSDAGYCSRREADRLTEAGQVTVNGQRALTGMQVEEGDVVCVNGKKVTPKEEKVYLAFNKPRGIVCTAEKREKQNIIDYISYPIRIYPVGRLDKDSEGLILLTNDGEIVNGIMRARNRHEKEYEVEVDRPITGEFLAKMAKGVPILDTVTRPCRIRKTSSCGFTIILTQGLNRQIRRMCEALGYRVCRLRRVRIMNIKLGDLPVGSYRELSEQELAALKQAIRGKEQ